MNVREVERQGNTLQKNSLMCVKAQLFHSFMGGFKSLTRTEMTPYVDNAGKVLYVLYL